MRRNPFVRSSAPTAVWARPSAESSLPENVEKMRRPIARQPPHPGAASWAASPSARLTWGSFLGASRRTNDIFGIRTKQALPRPVAGQRVAGVRESQLPAQAAPWLPMSSEICAVGEREVRIFKGFRCRLNCLTPRPRDKRSLGRQVRSSRGQSPFSDRLYVFNPCRSGSNFLFSLINSSIVSRVFRAAASRPSMAVRWLSTER